MKQFKLLIPAIIILFSVVQPEGLYIESDFNYSGNLRDTRPLDSSTIPFLSQTQIQFPTLKPLKEPSVPDWVRKVLDFRMKNLIC